MIAAGRGTAFWARSRPARGSGLRCLHAGLVLVAIGLALVGCASAPRGQSGALADSGLSATTRFSQDIYDLRTRLLAGDAENAFSQTWRACEDSKFCQPHVPSDSLHKRRQALASVIAARAQAVDALHDAYSALKAEADYDAKTDFTKAAGAALQTAQAYATLAGAAAIAQPVVGGVSLGVGLLAESRQAKRLRQANQLLAGAVDQLHAGLATERETFKGLAQEIAQQEMDAQQALVEAGLVSGSDALRPMVEVAGGKLASDSDKVLARSAHARTAVVAVVKTSIWSRTEAVDARYGASLQALDALKQKHLAAAKDQPISLTDVDRLLGELDALLPPPAPPRNVGP